MSAISTETKIDAVNQCYAGTGSLNQIAARFGGAAQHLTELAAEL